MGAGKGKHKRTQTAATINITVKGRKSGFDANVFSQPGLYGGDLAQLDCDTHTRDDSYYDDDGEYHEREGYGYDKIDHVRVVTESPNDILKTVMYSVSEETAFVQELKDNPYFFYGVNRACRRFKVNVEYADVDWESEPDYYGETLTRAEVGTEYDNAIDELGKEIEALYDLSSQGKNNEIIEEGLHREYGKLLPKLKGKNYQIQSVPVDKIVRRRTQKREDTIRDYRIESIKIATRSRTKKGRDSSEQKFAKLCKAQPIAIATPNRFGKYDIVDGYHRFAAITQEYPNKKNVKVLVAI